MSPRPLPILRITTIISVLSALGACGGGQPKPKDAESAESPGDAADHPKGEDAGSTGGDTHADPSEKPSAKKDSGSSKHASKPDEEPAKPARTARDYLTAPDVVFMFSFNLSDPKKGADEKCGAQSGDPKKVNACLANEQKKFEVDGFRFKEARDQWFWYSVRREGNRLVTVHKFEFEFGKDGEHSIAIKPIGKDLGKKPGRTPGETVFEVPNENQIVLTDPKLGRLVYEAKIGIASGGSD